ncbi:hypothetical protein VTN00DRAFT_770 [Thermoascus crustaceus]|uniref:uncharacterized protein n=1 Tax=Thermoascus crustaceus TaxID=5088 RepID=UPI0037420C09
MSTSRTGDFEEFATQVPSVQHRELSSALPRSPRSRPALGNELLGYLEPHARPADEAVQPQEAHSQDGALNDHPGAVSMETPPDAGPSPANGSLVPAPESHNTETQISLRSRPPQPLSHSLGMRSAKGSPVKRSPARTPPAKSSPAKSRPVQPAPARNSPVKRSPVKRSSAPDGSVAKSPNTIVSAQPSNDSVDSAPVSLTRPDQKQNDNAIEQVSPTRKSPKLQEGSVFSKRSKQACPRSTSQFDHSDPWKGMTRIRRSDIRIREDQLKLLESAHCWVPPEPGMRMPQCHVPPLLLQQWNDAMSRKKRSSEKQPEEGFPEETEPAFPVMSSSAMHSECESESEEEPYPWSSSPPNRDPQNLVVPADSSPWQRNHLDKRPAAEPAQHNDTSANDHYQRPQDTVPETVSGTTEGIALETDNGNALSAKQPQPVDAASDESDMDISVPRPLGAGSQEQPPSQEEEEPTSSGPPLPGSKTVEKIQVVDTSALDLERLRSKRLDGGNPDRENPASQHDSPRAPNTSSQSRIMNTYDSNGRVLREDQVENMRSSPVRSVAEDSEPQRTGNAATEDHDNLFSAEEALVNSQILSDFNLYSQQTSLVSSGQSISQAPSAIQEQTSQRLDQSQEVPESGQSDESRIDANHDSAPDSRADNPANVPTVSVLKRSGDEMEMEEQPSPKRQRQPQNLDAITVKNNPESSFSTIGIRQQIYVNNTDPLSKAQAIYNDFRYNYPCYQGDFTHFTKMCAKLQALRAKGQMQHSILWDDFVIRHLLDYPHYLRQCVAEVEEPQQYEDYFCFSFLKPSYKKRTLKPTDVEISAALAPTVGTGFSSNPAAVRTEPNISFTGSLVNRLSRLHTFSPPDAPPKDIVNLDRMPTSISSAAGQKAGDGLVPRKGAEDPNESKDGNVVEPEPSIHDTEVEEDDTESDDHESDDDNGENIDEYHETASIELGDQEDTTHRTNQATPGDDVETNVNNEGEDERTSVVPEPPAPREPLWSDSLNTPFKIWARADQNLLTERRRRGGAIMPTDDKGVIRPSIYPRKGWEGGMRTLGWNWRSTSKDYS